MDHTLFTYRNLKELRKFKKKEKYLPLFLERQRICSILVPKFASTYLHWFIFC